MSSTKPPGIDRLAQLSALHLYGMATAWSEFLAEGDVYKRQDPKGAE